MGLLEGKVAGLSITKPGGDPNGGFTLRLRGISTVGANASPLLLLMELLVVILIWLTQMISSLSM